MRPPPQVVLQQLVRPGGTGAGHQPHGGLVKKHLAENERDASSAGISTSCLCSRLQERFRAELIECLLVIEHNFLAFKNKEPNTESTNMLSFSQSHVWHTA